MPYVVFFLDVDVCIMSWRLALLYSNSNDAETLVICECMFWYFRSAGWLIRSITLSNGQYFV